MNTNGENNQKGDQLMKQSLFTAVKVGCLTLVIAGLALGIGLWIDVRQETLPRWTLIFLLGSLPLTLGGIFWMVRRSVKRLGKDDKDSEG
jgi:hypothetical protein